MSWWARNNARLRRWSRTRWLSWLRNTHSSTDWNKRTSCATYRNSSTDWDSCRPRYRNTHCLTCRSLSRITCGNRNWACLCSCYRASHCPCPNNSLRTRYTRTWRHWYATCVSLCCRNRRTNRQWWYSTRTNAQGSSLRKRTRTRPWRSKRVIWYTG